MVESENSGMDDISRLFASGDEKVFEDVVNQYSRKVYALCYRILRNEEEAKDMAQEVFVRVYRKRKSFHGRSSLYTWIYRIAVNMCLSHLKKMKVQTVPLDSVAGVLAARSDSDDPNVRYLEDIVSRAASELPARQRAVFAMRFYDKMSFKEIAQAMGISTGAARASYHFAIERLRKAIGG